jgi:lipopolysaccharide/colanic/teichoic acid biosynthesis glycosyltransferase
MDIGGALVVLLLGLPVLGLVAGLVYVDAGRPVLFRQRRAGRGAREFRLLKFRSMRPNQIPVNDLGQLGGTHPLITASGRWIRRFKLDELPQLVNVLRGDMSLVGPRPTVPEQVAAYDEFQRRRLLLRPGLTGWAQVNGNVRLDWSERIALDVWYVDHWSLWLDVRILLKTLRVVVAGERRNARALAQAQAHAHGTDWSR